MAATLASTIKGSLTWAFQDALDLVTVTDASKLEYSKAMASGTGDNQANLVWHDSRTVSGSSNDDLDLTALVNTIFGSTVTTNFAEIVALLIVNKNTVSGDDLEVGGAVSNQWVGPFGGATETVECPADSMLLLSNKVAGWPVVGGTGDILRIANTSGNSIDFDIVAVGRSV